jgi:acyl-CoA thioesterase
LPPAWCLPTGITPDLPFPVEVPALLCAEGDLLFGGWAMAVANEVAQAWSGLPVRALSTQFLSPARAGDQLEMTVLATRPGRRVTHCCVQAVVSGVPVFTTQLVLGDPGPAPPWTPSPSPPAVPPPEDCEQRTYRYHVPGSLADSLDVRLAGPEPVPGAGTGGRSLLWARVLAPASPQAQLAVLSDHVPYLLVRSVTGVRHATSVTASLRMTGEPAGEWVLLEVGLPAAGGEFWVGQVRQWSRAGALAALADQLVYVRIS